MSYLKKKVDADSCKHISTPSNPESGFLKVYAKSDGLLYKLTSAGVEAAVGSATAGTNIQIKTNVTEVSTTSSSETDLISYTMPAGQLAANGDQIEFEFAGTMASGMGNVQIKAKFGGTTICDSGSLMMGSAFRWVIKGRVIRDSSSSTQKIFCTLQSTVDTGPGIMTYTSGSIDLTATAILKATADVDDMMMGTPACVNEYLTVTYKPAA